MPQAHEQVQDLDLGLLEALFAHEAAHFLAQVGAIVLVEAALVGGERAVGDGTDFVGQVAGDLFFDAAQEEGVEFFAQEALGVFRGLAALGDGHLVADLEILVGAEVAWHQEVHDGPEIGNAVLDGRAGEDEAGVGHQALDGLGVLRALVFDGLRLVEHRHGITAIGMEGDVAPDERVAGDDEVVIRHLREEGGAVGARECQHL